MGPAGAAGAAGAAAGSSWETDWFPVLFKDWWMFHTWGLEALKVEDQWYKWYVLQLKLLAHPFFSLAESEPLPLALPWVSPLEVPLWARQELLSAPSKGQGTNGDQRTGPLYIPPIRNPWAIRNRKPIGRSSVIIQGFLPFGSFFLGASFVSFAFGSPGSDPCKVQLGPTLRWSRGCSSNFWNNLCIAWFLKCWNERKSVFCESRWPVLFSTPKKRAEHWQAVALWDPFSHSMQLIGVPPKAKIPLKNKHVWRWNWNTPISEPYCLLRET